VLIVSRIRLPVNARLRGHSRTLAQARAAELSVPVQGILCRLGLGAFTDDLRFRPSFKLRLRAWPRAEQALDLVDQLHAPKSTTESPGVIPEHWPRRRHCHHHRAELTVHRSGLGGSESEVTRELKKADLADS
jgi:hypothetical protein